MRAIALTVALLWAGMPAQAFDVLSYVAEIEAGESHTCAWTTFGAYCWGKNDSGQLGDGTKTDRLVATGVSGLSGRLFYPRVVGITAGGAMELSGGQFDFLTLTRYSHSCAVLEDGTAWCWGSNESGQLGDGANIDRTTPVQVIDPAGLPIIRVQAGGRHTCAIYGNTQAVKCWGANESGQLGNGTTVPSPVPVSVAGLQSGVIALALGHRHSCALFRTSVKCWGANNAGQLGDGTTINRTTPVDVPLSNVFGIAAGGADKSPQGYGNNGYSCAVIGNGSDNVSCWGTTPSSEGLTFASATHVQAGGSNDFFGTCPSEFCRVFPSHLCARASTGAVYCKGSNYDGQLGNGASLNNAFGGGGASATFVPVSGLGNAANSIGLGGRHSCAVLRDGHVQCWGRGGRLGDNTAASSSRPVYVLAGDPGAPPRLANLSTRAAVGTGEDVMIAGFIVGGSVNKQVVVNVAGPSLANYGISHPLANPIVTLMRSSDNSVVASNDDWQSQDAASVNAILASGLQPNHAQEPAVIASLAPGAYTAIAQGAGGVTGTGLVGVFEVDHPETPLTNISTRARVGTGEDVMIAGFIIQGTSPQTLVISVAGPSLASSGVSQPLQNPALTLVRSSDASIIAANDDWQRQDPANVEAIGASGYQPNNVLEPAIIVSLLPGAYTAIVSGVGGSTGVAVVGVFAAP